MNYDTLLDTLITILNVKHRVYMCMEDILLHF